MCRCGKVVRKTKEKIERASCSHTVRAARLEPKKPEVWALYVAGVRFARITGLTGIGERTIRKWAAEGNWDSSARPTRGRRVIGQTAKVLANYVSGPEGVA